MNTACLLVLLLLLVLLRVGEWNACTDTTKAGLQALEATYMVCLLLRQISRGGPLIWIAEE